LHGHQQADLYVSTQSFHYNTTGKFKIEVYIYYISFFAEMRLMGTVRTVHFSKCRSPNMFFGCAGHADR